MFADDTNLFLSQKNIDALFAGMTLELQNVLTWFKSNKFSVNVDKTKLLLFPFLSKKKLPPSTLPNLLIENVHIKRGHVTKILRVFVDANLSWKQYIDIVSSKFSKSKDILYKSRNVLSRQCLRQLYFSFIHS